MNGSYFAGNMPSFALGVVGMPIKAPFKLGPFSVDGEGRLSPADRGVAPGFSVRWRGRVVHARLEQCADRDGLLHIRSSLGRIPSSASDPAARVACFTVVRALLGALPRDWMGQLLPDHQPQLKVEAVVDLPITVTNLVVELALFLLILSPYLDLVDRVGFLPVAPLPGSPLPGPRLMAS
jgi:hypothetical protein